MEKKYMCEIRFGDDLIMAAYNCNSKREAFKELLDDLKCVFDSAEEDDDQELVWAFEEGRLNISIKEQK